MNVEFSNVKIALPSHRKNVLGYYELWGDYRPSGEESSRHYELCFYDEETKKWFKTDNEQCVTEISHWAELPVMPISDIDQRINIGWTKDFKSFYSPK